MKKPLALTAVSLMLGSGLAAVTAGTASADVMCRGTITASTDNNVQVPTGANCIIRSRWVGGNVIVHPGGSVNVYKTWIDGNIQAKGHRSVYVNSVRMNGNIQLENGAHATVLSNVVGGDIQLFSNRGAQRVFNNRVGGNLQCKSNSHKPTGIWNRVGGNIEDQCVGMRRDSVIQSRQRGTVRPSSNGAVFLNGHLKAFSGYGTLVNVPNGQRITVQVRYPGRSWTTIGSTNRTVNGYYTSWMGRRAGAELRLMYVSRLAGINSSFFYVGRMV